MLQCAASWSRIPRPSFVNLLERCGLLLKEKGFPIIFSYFFSRSRLFYFLPINNYCRQWNFAVVVRQITLEQDGAEVERAPTARWRPKRSSTRTGHFCRTVGGARSGLRDRSDGDGPERARRGEGLLDKTQRAVSHRQTTTNTSPHHARPREQRRYPSLLSM